MSYSTKLDPEYDPAIDDPDPESIKSRQIISSLLTMGLLLVYLCKTVVPLVWRFLRKHKNLAWMEEVYEGPFVDYRLKKLTPEERDRAGNLILTSSSPHPHLILTSSRCRACRAV